MPADKAAIVEHLRTRIAAIEKRPVLAEKTVLAQTVPGSGVLDLVAPPAGLLHEVFTDGLPNSGAALGFTFGMARLLVTNQRPAILYLQLARDAQEVGFPYAIGFARFGIDPDEVVLGRIETVAGLLWALEEAIACRAVAAVIADICGDHKELDFTVSRRLSLRTAAARTSAFLVRYGTGRQASASQLRWRIVPEVSAQAPFDPQAPGPSRFAVTLEKGRLGGAARRLEGQSFELEWVDHHGFVLVERSRTGQSSVRRPTAPSRPVPAVLGYRLPQAG